MIGKDLLGLKGLSKETISEILAEGSKMRDLLDQGEKDFNTLKGKNITTLFYENSTRTMTSFSNAGKFLGATVSNLAVGSSSVKKGESLIDTGETLDALNTDLIVIRHSTSGAPKFLADHVKAKVVNAGDGMHEHPTQALLDMLTMKRYFGKIEGLTVAIVGDVKHSRVARSNVYGLTTMGAKVRLFSPSTLQATDIDKTGNVTVHTDLREAIEGVDVVMGLRIQLERQQQGLFPSLSEYFKYYGVKESDLKYIAKNGIIMHPGPVNRDVELSSGVIDGANSHILDQVSNGLSVRMAILKLMLGGR